MRTTAICSALCVGLALAACTSDRHPAGDTLDLGPWLRVEAFTVRSAADEVTVERVEDGWHIAGTPFVADERRAAAVERTFRGPIAVTDSRDRRSTAAALGFGDGERLDVVVRPMDRPLASFSVGTSRDATTWIAAVDSDRVLAVSAPLRDRLGGGLLDWRSSRVLDLDADAIAWIRASEAVHIQRPLGAEWPGDGAARLRTNRLVRALASATGTPVSNCELERARAALTLGGAWERALTIGAPLGDGSRCLAVDGAPAFIVDAGLADMILAAPRVISAPVLPDLGSPDSTESIVVRDADVPTRVFPAGAVDRNFARAVHAIRPDALAPFALAALRHLPASRAVTLYMTSGDAHRIVLWWHPEHSTALAVVDSSAPFVFHAPAALRRPLEHLVAPAR